MRATSHREFGIGTAFGWLFYWVRCYYRLGLNESDANARKALASMAVGIQVLFTLPAIWGLLEASGRRPPHVEPLWMAAVALGIFLAINNGIVSRERWAEFEQGVASLPPLTRRRRDGLAYVLLVLHLLLAIAATVWLATMHAG